MNCTPVSIGDLVWPRCFTLCLTMLYGCIQIFGTDSGISAFSTSRKKRTTGGSCRKILAIAHILWSHSALSSWPLKFFYNQFVRKGVLICWTAQFIPNGVLAHPYFCLQSFPSHLVLLGGYLFHNARPHYHR